MTLDLGDTTFDLSYIGGMHTASDTAIFVPEHGLLLTGDTMADVWLTDTPGCLASFSVRDGMPHDFPALARQLGPSARASATRSRPCCPRTGTASSPSKAPRRGSSTSARSGTASARPPPRARAWSMFRPSSASTPASLSWWAAPASTRNGTTPPSPSSGGSSPIRPRPPELVFTLLSEGADEAAIAEVLADRDSAAPGYFFSEAEFNAYGYAFLQQDGSTRPSRCSESTSSCIPSRGTSTTVSARRC